MEYSSAFFEEESRAITAPTYPSVATGVLVEQPSAPPSVIDFDERWSSGTTSILGETVRLGIIQAAVGLSLLASFDPAQLGPFGGAAAYRPDRTGTAAASSSTVGMERLGDEVRAALELEDVEGGRRHPVEILLHRAFLVSSRRALDVVRDVIARDADSRRPLILALGRLPARLVASGCSEIIGQALADEDIGVRDAAVRALELWRTPEGTAMLRSHSEREHWLRSYIDAVLDDIA
jgi:hypothetical protein